MRTRLRATLFSTFILASFTLPISALRAQPAAETTDSVSERVVRAFLNAYAKRDLPAMRDLVSDDISWMAAGIDSIVRPYFRGKAGFDSTLALFFRQPQEGVVTVKSVTTVGPWLAAHWRTEKSSPTGTSTMMSLMVFEVRSGRIRRIWQYPQWTALTF